MRIELNGNRNPAEHSAGFCFNVSNLRVGVALDIAQFVQDLVQLWHSGIIAHVIGIVAKADAPFFVYDHERRHPSKF